MPQRRPPLPATQLPKRMHTLVSATRSVLISWSPLSPAQTSTRAAGRQACNRGLRGGFVGDGMGGQEIAGEALGVGGEKLFDAASGGRAENETGVMEFVNTFGNFGIAIGGSIRIRLTGEGDNDAGVVFAGFGELVWHFPGGYF